MVSEDVPSLGPQGSWSLSTWRRKRTFSVQERHPDLQKRAAQVIGIKSLQSLAHWGCKAWERAGASI